MIQDFLIMDEGVHWEYKMAIILISGSTIVDFKRNDMESRRRRRLLQRINGLRKCD